MSLRSTLCSSREKVGALAKACVKCQRFYRSTLSLNIGIVPETIGIIAIRIAGGESIDSLREQVTQRMISIRRMALVVHRGGQALCQADLAVDAHAVRGHQSRTTKLLR